ncbi:hypothetical protein AAEX28_04090 [Lentisphaerota bacterium WC36G]|nr:hypothetical protein LJT99_06960 [Lentisphaerae bacterium WC36]
MRLKKVQNMKNKELLNEYLKLDCTVGFGMMSETEFKRRPYINRLNAAEKEILKRMKNSEVVK